MDSHQQPDLNEKATTPVERSTFAQHYSEKGLWNKIKHAARATGEKTIYQVLVLFYTMREPSTPVWCKGVILGTLGYFISLIDVIPDLTPFLGYTDDISLIVAAIGTLAAYITPEIESKAQNKTNEIFKGEIVSKVEPEKTNPPSATQSNGLKK